MKFWNVLQYVNGKVRGSPKSYIFTCEDIRFDIFTCEDIRYTLYFVNIFLYFTTLYIIKWKFQIFLLNNMSFISLVKWKICIFHSWLRHSWNMNIFHFTRWNKIHIQHVQQKIWISSIYSIFLRCAWNKPTVHWPKV